MLLSHRLKFGLLSFVLYSASVSADTSGLTIEKAVAIALSLDDPSVAALNAQAKSMADQAVAASQLPDPQVKFGVANLATDSFKLSQEAMTNMQFGVHQTFVSGAKRKYARERKQGESQALLHQAKAHALIIALSVRKLWLKLYYLEQKLQLVTEKQSQLHSLHQAEERHFTNNNGTTHMIFAMDAEIALLADNLGDIAQKQDYTRVLIARYVGEENAKRSLMGSYENIPPPNPQQTLSENLITHPVLLTEQALIKASAKGVALAKQDYKPNWGLDVGYGLRSGGRADIATALITMDVPLFTGQRQDKNLSAAQKAKVAAEYRLQSKLRDMSRDMKASFAIWQRSSKRIDLFNRVILKRTHEATVASENAFANSSTDFTEVIRTHLSELDARIKLETIKWERAIAGADLLYFAGADLLHFEGTE